jgi:thiamine-phosphate pyrophosphorylase
MQTLEAQARRLKATSMGSMVPRLWLVSDPLRLPNPRAAAARLPPGSAVVARGLAPAVLWGLARLARQRRLKLMVAGDGRLALALAAGLHVPDRRGCPGLLAFLAAARPGALLSVAVHGRPSLVRARRLRADAALVSPAFATASHPGARALGPLRWAALAAGVPPGVAVVALGGLSGPTAARLPRPRLAGLAAIGALGGVTPEAGGGVAPE